MPSRHQHRQRLTRSIRLLTVLLGLALVTSTAACSDEPVEYFTPPPATDTTITPGELVEDEPEVFERPDIRTIAVPQYPQAANEVSEDGARAFAHYFLDILNYTAATGNTELLQSISGPECNFCQDFIATTGSLEATDQWVEGMNLTFAKDPLPVYDSGTAFGYETDVHGEPYEIWSKEGKVQSVTDQKLGEGGLVIYRLGDYWLVEDFGRRASE